MENLNANSQMEEQTATREIKMSELTAYVQEGKKKEDIMEIYGLKAAQVTKLMQQAKLTFRKFHKPTFVLVNDLEIKGENIPENNAPDIQASTTEDWS